MKTPTCCRLGRPAYIILVCSIIRSTQGEERQQVEERFQVPSRISNGLRRRRRRRRRRATTTTGIEALGAAVAALATSVIATSAAAPAAAPCSGYCPGVWPFGCTAEDLPNIVNYYCGRTEGCHYAAASSLEEEQGLLDPVDGFCLYKGVNVPLPSPAVSLDDTAKTDPALLLPSPAPATGASILRQEPVMESSSNGCLAVRPLASTEYCFCNANPTVSIYAACNQDNEPVYFDDWNDIPNGACIQSAHGQSEIGTSITTCDVDADCIESLTCQGGMCADSSTGKIEAERLVTACVSPKHTTTATTTTEDHHLLVDANNNYDGGIYSGCPFSDGAKILECHKYWISAPGMAWKRYIQHNPFGRGDAYAWAYDEAVCATSSHQMMISSSSSISPNSVVDQPPALFYPWCINKEGAGGAVDEFGNVIDTSCPCTVDNDRIAPLKEAPFRDQDFGTHVYIHVYDIMSPAYVPPTCPKNFVPLQLAHVPAENDEFYLKVINQYEDDILVYLDSPPARRDEVVSGPSSAKWEGWTGPTQTLRGEPIEQSASGVDPWVDRITLALNETPDVISQPRMRVTGNGLKTGGFYVPVGHHLRIHLATRNGNGGWFQTHQDDCPNLACLGSGSSLWFTRADAYTYADRDPLLLAEINVNDFSNDPSAGGVDFANGTIWMDLSAVDGVNANLAIRYGRIDRAITVPLHEKSA